MNSPESLGVSLLENLVLQNEVIRSLYSNFRHLLQEMGFEGESPNRHIFANILVCNLLNSLCYFTVQSRT